MAGSRLSLVMPERSLSYWMPAFAGMTMVLMTLIHTSCEPRKESHMAIYELDGERPELPADGLYWIAETAVVVGRVRLKSDASIWWGSVLRGDNEWIEVGMRSQVQDNATLHTDPGFPLTIGESCVIGHNVVLHGCSIGDNSLIGMGAVVLNGARIGANSLVGAGALVTEGKEFPDNLLIVGAPAKAVREVDEKAMAMIARGADVYVRRWRQYAAGLKRIG
jgi:carbonic anhydrase/acetyltransferase-like protein (isoleucine patch superfamily)